MSGYSGLCICLVVLSCIAIAVCQQFAISPGSRLSCHDYYDYAYLGIGGQLNKLACAGDYAFVKFKGSGLADGFQYSDTKGNNAQLGVPCYWVNNGIYLPKFDAYSGQYLPCNISFTVVYIPQYICRTGSPGDPPFYEISKVCTVVKSIGHVNDVLEGK